MAVHKPIFTAEVYAPKSIDPTEATILTPVAGAAHSDPFRIATADVPGFKPYLQIPTGRRGKVDIKTKNTDIGSLTLTALDPRVAPGSDNRLRWFTQFLGDGKGIDRILRCKLIVKRSIDGGVTFTEYFTGRIKDAKQKEILEFTLALNDVMGEADMTLFASQPHASVSYAQINPILPFSLDKDWLGFKQELPILSQVRTAAQGYQRYVNVDYRSSVYAKTAILSEGLRKLAGKIKSGASGLLFRRELTFPIGRIRARIKNRSTNVVGWYDIPYMVFYQNVDKHWQLGNYAVELIAGVSPAFPGAGTQLEARFFAQAIPTDDAAIFIDRVEIPVLLKDICAGKFAPLDTAGNTQWSIPIDEASFDALIGDPRLPKVAFRITEQTSFKEWVPTNLLLPFQLSLDPTPDGKLRLVDMRLSEQLTGLDPDVEGDVVTDTDLVSKNEGEGWKSLGDEAINRVDAWYYRATMQPQIQPAADKSEFPTVPPARIDIAPQPVIPLYISPRSLDFGTKNFKLDLKGILANGDNDIIITLVKDSWDDVEAIRIAERLSDELQGPFQAGAQYLETTCRINDKTELIKPGTRKIVKISTLADPYSKRRGEPQYAVCLDRQEANLTTKFTWLALGPAGITDPPTISSIDVDGSDVHHSITVSFACNSAGDPVVIEYALTSPDIDVRPVGGWVRGRVAPQGSSGTYNMGRFPSNTRVWVRAYSSPRLANIKRPDSAFAYPDVPADGWVFLIPYSPPVSLTLSGTDGNRLSFTMVPGEPQLGTQLLMKVGEEDYADWSDADVIETFEAGVTTFNLSIALPAGITSFGVRHIDLFGGVTTITQINVDASGIAVQAPRPAGFDFIPGSSIVLEVFTSDPTFFWVVDRAPDNGSNAPNLGAIERIIDVGQQILSSQTLIYDPLPPNGAKWWYQVYLGKPGYLISDPIPWKAYQLVPVDINGDGLADNLTGNPSPSTNLEAVPVEPTFNYVASQTETVGTLTVTVNDPQRRVVTVEFKTKVGFSGVESAYAEDPTTPYSQNVSLILGETSLITVKITYYQADGTLRTVEQTRSFSRANTPGNLVAEYVLMAPDETLPNSSVLTESDTVGLDVSVAGIVRPFVEPSVIDPGTAAGRPANWPLTLRAGPALRIVGVPPEFKVWKEYAEEDWKYCNLLNVEKIRYQGGSGWASGPGVQVVGAYSLDGGLTWAELGPFYSLAVIKHPSLGDWEAVAGPALVDNVVLGWGTKGGDGTTTIVVGNIYVDAVSAVEPPVSVEPSPPSDLPTGEPWGSIIHDLNSEAIDQADLSPVTTWVDQSVTGQDAVKEAFQSAPTFLATGWDGTLPCVNFGGGTVGLTVQGQITNSTFTTYIVASGIVAVGFAPFWDADNGYPFGKGLHFGNGTTPTQFGGHVNTYAFANTFIWVNDDFDKTQKHIYRFGFDKDGGAFKMWVDGVVKISNSCNPQVTSSVKIYMGYYGSTGNALQGKYAREVTWDRYHSAGGLNAIEILLKAKWGTP